MTGRSSRACEDRLTPFILSISVHSPRLFARRVRVGIRWLLFLTAVANVYPQAAAPQPPGNLAALKSQALALLADVVPQPPVADTPATLSYRAAYACWGTFFGDEQVAALVALESGKGRDQNGENKADLCLLRWEPQGWTFAQWVGQITSGAGIRASLDWALKRRAPGQARYVLSRLSLYPAGEHLSWWCDAKTHTLLPTGWRKDAVPSIAADTITFTHEDRPGYTPRIRDIYRFADQVGTHLATCVDEPELHLIGTQLTIWEAGSGKAVTWQAQPAKSDGRGRVVRYALCRSDGEQPAKPFREDAVATFEGGGDTIIRGPVQFLWWRLTGLSANALNGAWDQDETQETILPQSVAVSGLPEAIRRFTWPEP